VEDGTMREAKTKEIDGIQFSVTPFPAIEAFKLKAYLLKKFAPAFSQILEMVNGIPKGGTVFDITFNGDVITKAVKELITQLDEEEFTALLRRLLQNVCAKTSVDGKALELYFTKDTFEASLDIVFSGSLFTVYPVLLFVLEANFPDFFGKMGGIGGKIQKMLSSEPQKPASKNGSEK
jgi:hypothetical protein